MIAITDIETLIKNAIPDAAVNIADKNGMSDHFLIYVEAKSFENQNLMDRHRSVMAALEPAMKDGRLHAAEIKTALPV
ncbi:MAG: BolA/IbaG family iron-sulfur metabolism protein [Vampirovibrionales bacterium]|nr:BolA/IbaG family iron-sulfur metabolism protein [Vampirovibrionales bacterium]